MRQIHLNIGIEYVNSKYILRVDPDDTIEPNRIKLQYEFLEKHTSIGCLGTNAKYFRGARVLNVSNFPLTHKEIRKRYLRGEHGVLHGTVMIRTSIFKKFKYRQEFVPAEDYDIFSRIIDSGILFSNIVEPLTNVRIHGNSVSNDLKFDTIIKTYLLRQYIFGISISAIKIRLYYLHMMFYRRFLFEGSSYRYIYLLLSVVFNPIKLLRRIK